MSADTFDDDDDEFFEGAYEDGHWEWDENVNGLVFISDVVQTEESPEVVMDFIGGVQTGAFVFNDDLDVLEQVRFRKRYARKITPGEPDVITLQDVKDLALFTAPLALLSDRLIDMLHTPTTERFIRALILYCQYFLQVEKIMMGRTVILERKIRTPESDIFENELRENLNDLRAMVAKEYSVIVLGGADTKRFHHMGPRKDQTSLAHRDAKLFESLLRFCIQIVWLALSRNSFAKIELEINRLLKTDIYNSVEHKNMTGYYSKMPQYLRRVLLGTCIKPNGKLNSQSILANEAFCHRNIDYRMMGLGVIQYNDKSLTDRLRYLLLALVGPESELVPEGVSLGILGLPRSSFDIMLRTLSPVSESSASKSPKSKSFFMRQKSRMASMASVEASRSTMSGAKKSKSTFIYQDILLPRKSSIEPPVPAHFPGESAPRVRCSEAQRNRWKARLHRLRNFSSRQLRKHTRRVKQPLLGAR